MTGNVFNIQRCCADDGEGIRTTVFLKGCPLCCIWCHNPESIRPDAEIFYYPSLCIGCGACVAACGKGCHTLNADGHRFDRTCCVGCGACARACPATALERVGDQMSTEQVMDIVRRDRDYYGKNGGLTLSGGEPLLQWRFSASLAEAAKAEGFSVYVETCGYGKREALDTLMPWTDCFLFDIKAVPARHAQLTGVDSSLILENLVYLDERKMPVILRCPIVPGCNDQEEHYRYIASLAAAHQNVREIHLEPYHPLGITKAAQLGKRTAYQNPLFMEKERLIPFREMIGTTSGKPTIIL